MSDTVNARRVPELRVIASDKYDMGPPRLPANGLVDRGGFAAFDFDLWVERARCSPHEFETERRRILEQVIADSRDPERLGFLQWRIEAERRRARSAFKACLVFSGMMWEVFAEMREALNQFVADAPPPRLKLVSNKFGSNHCLAGSPQGPGPLPNS